VCVILLLFAVIILLKGREVFFTKTFKLFYQDFIKKKKTTLFWWAVCTKKNILFLRHYFPSYNNNKTAKLTTLNPHQHQIQTFPPFLPPPQYCMLIGQGRLQLLQDGHFKTPQVSVKVLSHLHLFLLFLHLFCHLTAILPILTMVLRSISINFQKSYGNL